MDKGPWGVWPVTAWDSAAGRNVITDYEVWSDDFEHDVKLRVLGDFSDLAQKCAYAQFLANSLNGVSAGKGAQQG